MLRSFAALSQANMVEVGTSGNTSRGRCCFKKCFLDFLCPFFNAVPTSFALLAECPCEISVSLFDRSVVRRPSINNDTFFFADDPLVDAPLVVRPLFRVLGLLSWLYRPRAFCCLSAEEDEFGFRNDEDDDDESWRHEALLLLLIVVEAFISESN